jgi:hypothetical protein
MLLVAIQSWCSFQWCVSNEGRAATNGAIVFCWRGALPTLASVQRQQPLPKWSIQLHIVRNASEANFASTIRCKYWQSSYRDPLKSTRVLRRVQTDSESKSKLLYDRRSISQDVFVSSPLWNLWLEITSCGNVAVWNLRSCFCGAPSLTRRRVFSLQCNHSKVRIAQNP